MLVVEDGPTLTHGEMPYGAGVVAANRYHGAKLVDPRPYAVGSIRETFEKFPHIGKLLPAMGYSETQRHELEETIKRVPCDVVLVATPIDLSRVIHWTSRACACITRSRRLERARSLGSSGVHGGASTGAGGPRGSMTAKDFLSIRDFTPSEIGFCCTSRAGQG